MPRGASELGCLRWHYEYGIRRAVNLVQDIFMDFLNSALYFDYMVEDFNVNPDLESKEAGRAR